MTSQDPRPARRRDSRILGNAIWTAVGLILIGGVRIALGVTAESFFGVEGLAFVTAALSVAAIATIVGSGGLSAGITKLISELRGQDKPQEARRFAAATTRIALTMTTVGALAAAGYAVLDQNLESGGPLVIVSTALLTLSFGTYLAGKAIAFGEDLVKKYVGLEALGALCFAVALWLVVVLDRPEGIILPLAVAYVPVGLVSLSRATTRSSPWGNLPMRALGQYGAIGSVGSLAGVGFTRATPLVAGFLGGTAGVALVGASLFVLEPLFLAPRAISLVLLPSLSFAHASGARREAAATLRVSTGTIAVLAAPFCALLVLEQDRILQLIFSEQIVGGPTLAWFSVAFFARVLGTPAVTSLAAIRARDASIPMLSSLIGFAVAGIIWVVAGPAHGTMAVGVGYAAGSVIQVAAPLFLATRRYEAEWGSFFFRVGSLIVMVGVLTLMKPSLTIDIAAVIGIALLLYPETKNTLRAVLNRRDRS